MAAATTTISQSSFKVALVLNNSNASGGECVELTSNSHVKIGRPGAAVAKKKYGPFSEICSDAASLFDSPTIGISEEVEEALRNGTSFSLVSFGAKGQGKTTALWGSAALGPEHAIIPRTIGELFAAIERVKDKDDQVGVAVSFLRVSATGEMLNDCLVEDIEASGLGLRLREAIHPILPSEFFLEGQQRRVVSSVEELSAAALDGLDRAEMIDLEDDQFNRGTRSHKLLTVTVIRRAVTGDLYNSKIHLLDTVGVDRDATKTASKPFSGKTAVERKADLKSKKPAQAEDVTVKAIIRCFDSKHDKSKHIPYRDSKLTRLLKNSLEEGRCIMLGCLSSANASHAESDAMLQFFHKCSTLTMKPSPFVVNPTSEIARREPRILELAAHVFPGKSPSEVMCMQPSDVECTLDSPPERTELCELLTELVALQTDPLASLLRGEPVGLP